MRRVMMALMVSMKVAMVKKLWFWSSGKKTKIVWFCAKLFQIKETLMYLVDSS